MKSQVLWSIFFILGTPVLIFLCLTLLLDNYTSFPILPPPPSQILGLSTSESNSMAFPNTHISFKIKTADSRSHIIQNYLKKYNSPLLPHSQYIVDISDKYSLDYRLLVAIARQESNLCKFIPENSYNCWGFGIYGNNVVRFSNYEEGIEKVAESLKKNYIDKGLDTPEEIMAKYTPPSLEKGGAWAKAINTFLTDLE